MPRLHYSNRLERLIVPLAQELEKRDPFNSADIVVPNFSLEKWISLKLAQIQGIAANLRFITLEKAINEVLQENMRDRHYALLKPETTQCLLLELIREKLETSDPLWQQVRSYITPDTSIRPEAGEHRLYQLAGRLTHLFMEYELSRNEELLTPWVAGRNALDFDPLGTESWQRALWTELFGPEGKVTRHNRNARLSVSAEFQPELFSLPQLYRHCQDNPNRQSSKLKTQGHKTETLHIFGVSYLSRFHQKVLTEQLAHLRDIHVYALNPCMEFWEDVQSLGESKATVRRSLETEPQRSEKQKGPSETKIALGELFQDENDNPFLQAWGRPGRENISLLNQWSEWNYEPWFVENESAAAQDKDAEKSQASVLNQLQQDILFREPSRASSLGLEQDESLLVLACANPRREVESVASLIWDWIRRDPDLRLNECAVIVHDMERYQHEIEQVFESIYSLPYHLIDGISGSAGRLEDAANSLLGLCFTEYTRRDLFRLINNPCFLQKFEDSATTGKSSIGEPLQIKQWLQWADELNIFYGIDKESQEEQGYLHLEQDIYHWEQAFRRLTLGEMVSAEDGNGIFSIGRQNIVPMDLAEEWSTEAARFMLIVRSLIADTRDLPKWKMSAKDWGRYLHTLLKTYLRPLAEDDEEAFQNLLKNVLAARDLDLGHEGGPSQFSFSTIYEFFKQKQRSAKVHRGHYLAEGVTVSSFQPMRPIPFKVVFLLGMGEGLFPTPYHRDTLDLRHIPEHLSPAIEGHTLRERRLGDVSVTERDRYMFLETLVSTRKHLVLSYVSRNDRTDDELNPSSIIQTLVDELDSGYLKAKFKKTRHPLKSYSLEYFPELSESHIDSANILRTTQNMHQPNYDPAAFRQARAFRLRELFNKKFPGFQRISPDWLSADVRHSLTGQSLRTEIPGPVSENQLSIVSFSRLRKFLESPLQSTAGYLLGLGEDEDDVGEIIIDEPLVLERLNEWSLLRKVWNSGLSTLAKESLQESQPEWLQLYQLQAQRMELEGVMPTGIFGEAMQDRHLRILKSWQKQLTAALQIDWQTLQKNLCQFYFGAVREGIFKAGLTSTDRFFPVLHIQKDETALPERENLSTEIQGKTEWWYTDESNNWHGIYLSERQSKDKSWLRHFLDVLILRAADLFPDQARVTGLCIAPEGKLRSRNIHLPSRQQAQDYLANLVQEMNTENAAVLMPVESVLELEKENLTAADYNPRFSEWMDSKLNSSRENLGISSQYGPVKFLNDAIYPENPYQLKNSRFQLFFETVPA